MCDKIGTTKIAHAMWRLNLRERERVCVRDQLIERKGDEQGERKVEQERKREREGEIEREEIEKELRNEKRNVRESKLRYPLIVLQIR